MNINDLMKREGMNEETEAEEENESYYIERIGDQVYLRVEKDTTGMPYIVVNGAVHYVNEIY